MSLDSDIALLGTGIAPLIAANHFLNEGKSVLLLNPDRDFFLENSELPFDPLIYPAHTNDLSSPLFPREKWTKNSPEHVLAQLRPDFPGAIEFGLPSEDPSPYQWTYHGGGFHDHTAPHVRQRARLWISSSDQDPFWNWEKLDSLFVETSDLGLKPLILEDGASVQRFPGSMTHNGNYRGVYLPKLCDVDLVRYRNGLLEFVRERLTSERVVCDVNQLERMPQGVRFNSKHNPCTAKLKLGMLVFWTPHLSSWILNQSRKLVARPKLPKGLRHWEQWTLATRLPHDPRNIGIYGNLAVWADFEGLPSKTNHPLLSILRAGPILKFEESSVHQNAINWASSESFDALSNLCHGLLKWDKFSIRTLKTRTLLEWDHSELWNLSQEAPLIQVVPRCDGPLGEVIETARSACRQLLRMEETK